MYLHIHLKLISRSNASDFYLTFSYCYIFCRPTQWLTYHSRICAKQIIYIHLRLQAKKSKGYFKTMETKVLWYPFSLPDYLMLCLIAWFFGGANPVVSMISLNFFCCSPAELIQVCKCFHNVGLHLHIMCSIMNPVLFSRTSIVIFPNLFAHESLLVKHQELPLSLPSFHSYSHCAVKTKHIMKGVLISQAKSNPLQVLCCSPLCTYPIRPLSRAALVFPSQQWYILAVKGPSANPPSSGLPPACRSRSDCFLQSLHFHFKAFGKLRKE